ncbi:hypothetical protein HAX54_010861, partial [Datura stramonium]|nr:hypothetical protein [Datura stramonium]
IVRRASRFGARPGARRPSSRRYDMREAALSQRCSRRAAAPSPRDGRRATSSFQARWHFLLGTGCGSGKRQAERLPKRAVRRTDTFGARPSTRRLSSRRYGMCEAALSQRCRRCAIAPSPRDDRCTTASF